MNSLIDNASKKVCTKCFEENETAEIFYDCNDPLKPICKRCCRNLEHQKQKRISLPTSSGLQDFDVSRFKLGVLCKQGHEYKNTGQSLKRISGACICCEQTKHKKEYKKKTKQCDICHQQTTRGGVRPVIGQFPDEKYFCYVCIKSVKHKKCTKCETIKPLTDFHKGKRTPDGRRSACNQCVSEQYKGYKSPAEQQQQQEYKRRREETIAQLQAATHKECTKCKQLLPKENFKPRKTSIDGLNQQCRECVSETRLKYRRANGINPQKPQYTKMQILESFVGKIEEAEDLVEKELYYLGGLCVKGHDWHGTGYTLRFKSNTHCLECERIRMKKKTDKYKEKYAYQRWLKNPRISPSVAELVEKSEQWARGCRKELFMTPEEREEYKRKAREAYKKRYQENPEREKLRIKKWKHANPQRIDNHNKKRIDRVRSKSDGTVSIDVVESVLNSAKQCIYCSLKLTPETATVDHIEPLALGGLHSSFNLVACCRSCNSKKRSKPFHVWLSELPEPNKSKAEQLYRKRYGASPLQGVLPLSF